MTLDDIRRLNIREAGNWPLLPKIVIPRHPAGAHPCGPEPSFDWSDQIDALNKAQDQETKLREA